MPQKMSATVKNKFQVSYVYLPRNVRKCQVPYLEMIGTYSYVYLPRNVRKCQVPYLEMIGTYPIAGIHETVRY